MNALPHATANALPHGELHATHEGSVAGTVHAKTREEKGIHHTSPHLKFLVGAEFASWRWVTYRARLANANDGAPRKVRRCESCGVFVPHRHMRTARYFYDIDSSLPVSVYSLATARMFQERLDCANCSMKCCRMGESFKDRGVAVGPSLPNGWVECSPNATQADFAEVAP